MGYLSEEEAKVLIQDKKLVDEVVRNVIEDPKAMEDLAEEIADDIAGALEDDPVFKTRLVEAAMKSPELKKRIIQELLEEMG